MPRTDWKVIKNYKIQLPSISEQHAIVTVLSDMEAEVYALEQQRDKIRQIKHGMMQELLTGRTASGMKVFTIGGVDYRLPDIQSPFRQALYVHLINWKWQHISREPGAEGDILYDAFLPEACQEQFPFIYPGIVPAVCEHLRLFPFRVHLYFNHMASSQAANLNLFLPILLHPRAAEVLRAVKPDIVRLATDRLYHGFCVEYWDGVEGEKKRMYRGIKYKGLLNDKKGTTGTDADIAIAYYNPQNELCLWLVEHKLCEAEFTSCGGYRSLRNQGKHRCANHFSDILANKELCHYHSYNHYNYWRITEANSGFFANHAPFRDCPFPSVTIMVRQREAII